MKFLSTTIRLDRFLSNAGIISRRNVKQFLKNNKVTVDGKRITESREKIATTGKVLVNGERVTKPDFVYYILNKPVGIISTTNDELARDTVVSLIDTNESIYPVGRLDKDSHGLVLLTNDGKLTHQLIHPRYHVPKVYRIIAKGHPLDSQLHQMRMGVILDDRITLPAEVVLQSQTKEQATFHITLHEGRNRQIRRMCEEVGIDLLDLQRICFGPITLGDLKRGKYRKLTRKEIQSLQDIVKKSA